MFIDTSIWIGLKHSRDRWHEESKKLINKILNLNRFYVTDKILTETYNYLLRKVSTETAMETFDHLTTNSRCEIVFNNEISLKGTKNILDQYSRLSFTDANIVWHAKNFDLKEIMSFDQGFDGINGIIRIH